MAALKFVMFPSGVLFVPALAKHDECRLVGGAGEDEVPVAAGRLDVFEGGRCSLNGCSINLGLSSLTAYPDWLERSQSSGVAPQQVSFSSHKREAAFFFPFKPVREFQVRGIGAMSAIQATSYEELCAFARS